MTTVMTIYAEPRRAVDSPTDSPAIMRSPLAAEPGTPTTRCGVVSELAHSLTQPRRGSRLKSKPRWQQDFEIGVKLKNEYRCSFSERLSASLVSSKRVMSACLVPCRLRQSFEHCLSIAGYLSVQCAWF